MFIGNENVLLEATRFSSTTSQLHWQYDIKSSELMLSTDYKSRLGNKKGVLILVCIESGRFTQIKSIRNCAYLKRSRQFGRSTIGHLCSSHTNFLHIDCMCIRELKVADGCILWSRNFRPGQMKMESRPYSNMFWRLFPAV